MVSCGMVWYGMVSYGMEYVAATDLPGDPRLYPRQHLLKEEQDIPNRPGLLATQLSTLEGHAQC